MADVLCFGASIFISILGFLVVFNQTTDTFTKEYELLEISDFILAQNWEGNQSESGIYGLSTVVDKGGFPTHLSNRLMKQQKRASKCIIPFKNCSIKSFVIQVLLLLSGDISLNPGPARYPCGLCEKPVHSNQHGLQCDDCNIWTHRTCLSMDKNKYMRLADSDEFWFCRNCTLPNFTDSFFSCNNSISGDSSFGQSDTHQPGSPVLSPGISVTADDNRNQSYTGSDTEEQYDIFKELRELRKGNLSYVI